jgi:hypothetical protein
LYHSGTDAGEYQRSQNHGEPLKTFLPCRSGDRERHAKNQAGDEPSEMTPVIDPGEGRTECQVENDKEDHAAHDLSLLKARNRHIAELNSGENRSSDSEDSARRSNLQPGRVNRSAEQSSAHAGQHINRKSDPAPEQTLRKLSQIPQAPHVEADVKQTAMNKTGCDEAPIIAGEGRRSIIAAKVIEGSHAKLPKRTAGEHHKNKNNYVDGGEDRGGRKLPQCTGVHSHPRPTCGASGAAVA